jgi:hypothetical protein
MEFKTTIQKFDSKLWGHHIEVPAAVAQIFVIQGSRRIVCTLNSAFEFQAALMPKGDGMYFININKSIRDKLALKVGSPVVASLARDESDYGLPMPEELAELLSMDEAGNRHFHNLTPGKQRSLLYIAGSPKHSDIRIRRSIDIVDHLKATGGKLNFRQLYDALKESQ